MTELDPDRLVRRFVDGILGVFPDLAFLSPGGRLYVNGDTGRVRRIRIQLPADEYLHLHSLTLQGEGTERGLRGATWTASSTWSEFAPPPDPLALFHPAGEHICAFHTDLDERPWLEVVLSEPVSLEQLGLTNVPSATSSRASGIQVQVADDGPWRTLYDGHARVSTFRRLSNFLLAYPPGADERTAMLTTVLVDIGLGLMKRAQERLAAIPSISEAQRKDFRAAVSTYLLAGHELEWTIHGVHRSFRFWTDEERVAYVDHTVQLARDLGGLSPNVCFGFGAALAVVRNGELIPHDDDLDLLIGLEPGQASTLLEGIELVRNFLRPLGYVVEGSFFAHQHVRMQGASKNIDVFIGLFEGDQIDWYPGARGQLDRATMFPVSRGSLLGHDCPLPRNPLVYLEKIYGPGWRTPDAGFRHQWRQAPYFDISGRRTPRN